jgi:glycerol kinase
MTAVVLGLDQGTSSTRCLVLDHALAQRGAAAVPVSASFPGPGLVEQDPGELVASARTAVALALADAGAAPADVVAVGIANQTETFIVSERGSRRPIHPAIVWQDRRTQGRCDAVARTGRDAEVRALTGLELDPTFPATKIGWLLDHVDGARAAAEAGELVYHDVAGWLIAHLAGGDVCEASNAGRTLLCALGGEDWDDRLLDVFGIPRAMLPPIVASDGIAAAAGSAPAGGLPVTGALGDQQASLFGLRCLAPGTAKITLGTGAFILAQAGTRAPVPPSGVLASCAWRRRGQISYALEGFVPAAGSALDWFAQIGILPPAAQLDALLSAAGPDDGGAVACVPALQGLGTPGWDGDVRAALIGCSRATTRAQIARAVVDGVLHQVADALAAIATEMALEEVLLDGGMSRSEWVTRRLAELAGVRVRRAARAEATAIGAAMIAGLAAGFWNGVEELPEVATDLVAEPSWGASERDARRRRWADAVAVAQRWRPEAPAGV